MQSTGVNGNCRMETQSFLAPFDLGGSLAGIDISPDGNTLAIADQSESSTSNWIDVVDLTTGTSRRITFDRGSYETGTFTYLPKAGTVLAAGNQTLSVAFLPADTTDYTTAAGSTNIIVVGRVSRSKSTIAVSSSSMTAGGETMVTLTVRDAYGHQELRGGLAVRFALESGSAGGRFSHVKDHRDGTYTATFTATAAGSDTITTIIDGHPSPRNRRRSP